MKRILPAFVLGLILAAMPQSLFAQDDVEAKVREVFTDAPTMIAVAKCESGYRQFAPDGSVLRGGPSKQYVGIFQIDENIHTKRAAGMGFDILTVDGNIGFALQLHSERGTVPWKGCVPKSGVIAEAPSVTVTEGLTANLRFGMTHPQVRTLQRLLNASGFAVAASGVGSSGNETTIFGTLTREAVKRFQCAKGIACDGDETTTGYGRVGPKTRAALSQP